MLSTDGNCRAMSQDTGSEGSPPLEPPPRVATAFDGTGKEYYFKPGELLVAREDVGRVQALLHRTEILSESPESDQLGNVVRLILGGVTAAGLDAVQSLPQLVEDLRSEGPTPPVVGPNHYFHGHTHASWHTGKAAVPHPAPPHRDIPHHPNLPGRGIRVAVVDTGAENRWFPGTIRGPGDSVTLHGPGDSVTRATDGSLAADAGHGTFVTGVVLQHAPGAEVVVVPVLVDNFTDEAALTQVLLDLPDDIDVLNLSLGCYTAGDLPPTGLQSAIDTLRERNPRLVVVASAGNDGWNRPCYPAALKGVIGVAALDADRASKAEFSNFGPWVDAAAPGQDVDSSFLDWDGPVQQLTNGRGDGIRHDFDGWATWSGTSFAAPAVAGAIAALASTGLGALVAADVLIHGAGVPRLPGLGAILDPPVYA
jgi:hypothetical protein